MNKPPAQGYHVTDEDLIIPIPSKVLAMLTWEGYLAMFWHFVQEREYLHRDAWAACEKTLEDCHLPGRYDSYESFKNQKSRREGDGAGLIMFF